jgi:hypothetical protein
VDDLDGARARILLTKRILHWSPPTVAVEGLYPRVCAVVQHHGSEDLRLPAGTCRYCGSVPGAPGRWLSLTWQSTNYVQLIEDTTAFVPCMAEKL